jgi:ribonuclease R
MSAFAVQLSKGCLPSDIEPEDKEAFETLRELGALERTDKGLYRLNSLYRVGRFSIDKEGRGFVEAELKEQRDLLIFADHFNGARNGDFVVAKRFMSARGRPSGRIVAVIKRAKLYTNAYTRKNEAGALEVIDIRTGDPVKAQMKGVPLESFKIGTVFKIDIDTDEVVESFGHLGDARVDEKISLALYHRYDAFPKACIEEAEAIPKRVDASAYPQRVDLRHLPFCTIDPVTAKDFDDAIYFDTQRHVLYVAIADVSAYVPYYSEIDKEAKKRGFTTYFPHKAFPMLPRELSEDVCSLKPRVDRLAFVCEIALDKNTLEPLSEKFYEAIIHSHHRFNYDRIDHFIQTDGAGAEGVAAELWRYLGPLYRITQRLRKARLQKGFDFRSDEIKLTIDAEHKLVDTQIETGTPAHSLIEECMLLANKAAAKRFSGEGDAIFRIHEPPEVSKIEELLTQLAQIGIFVEEYETAPELIRAIQNQARKLGMQADVDALLIKSLKQATYSPFNVGHFGLGFEAYSHFTSPIRRYSDLILHRLIKAQLRDDKEEIGYLLRNIEPLCVRVSALERESTKAEWDFRDRKFARWAADHQGERFKAKIVEIDGESGAAKADIVDERAPQGITVHLRADKAMLFDDVVVRISDVDIARATIMAEEVGDVSA